MYLSRYISVFAGLLIIGCAHPMVLHSQKNYKPYVSSNIDEKSYVSSTPTTQELVSAFEEVVKEDDVIVKGWVTPRGSISKGVTLQDIESRGRLNDALHSTPLGGVVKWQKGGVSFELTPNSSIYEAYKSGGMCRDAFLIIYDSTSDETIRGLFCKRGITSDWLLLR